MNNTSIDYKEVIKTVREVLTKPSKEFAYPYFVDKNKSHRRLKFPACNYSHTELIVAAAVLNKKYPSLRVYFTGIDFWDGLCINVPYSA